MWPDFAVIVNRKPRRRFLSLYTHHLLWRWSETDFGFALLSLDLNRSEQVEVLLGLLVRPL